MQIPRQFQDSTAIFVHSAWMLTNSRASIAVRIVLLCACVVAASSGMACSESPATQVIPDVIPSGASHSFELSGMAIGDDGRPVPNASVSVNFKPATGGHFIGITTRTDGNARYQVNIDALTGGYSRGTTALVVLVGEGYEVERRWFRPTGSDSRQTVDLHPRLIRQMTAGDSVSVTVSPDDPPCINNVQDIPGLGPSYVCRTVRILSPVDGVLTVEAVSTDARASRPPLEMEATTGPDDCCFLGNPLSLAVVAGLVVKVNVELLEGLPTQTFILRSTIR